METVTFEIKSPQSVVLKVKIERNNLIDDYLGGFTEEVLTDYKYVVINRSTLGFFYKFTETLEEAKQTVENLLKQ